MANRGRPVFDDLQAVAVELGFMQPGVAGRHGLGADRSARANELEQA